MGRGSRASCGRGAWGLCERGVRGPRYTGALAAARAGGRNSGCGAAPLLGRTPLLGRMPLPFIGHDPTPRVRSLTPSGRGARSRVGPLFAEDARRTERRGSSPRYRSSIGASRIETAQMPSKTNEVHSTSPNINSWAAVRPGASGRGAAKGRSPYSLLWWWRTPLPRLVDLGGERKIGRGCSFAQRPLVGERRPLVCDDIPNVD